MLEACGTLTDTLARCAAIEASYRDRDLPDSDHLEDTVVELYVSISDSSAEMVSQNKMEIVRRVLTSISSLVAQPLQNFRTKLNAKEGRLAKVEPNNGKSISQARDGASISDDSLYI